MSGHLTHPVTGILASLYSAVSASLEFFEATLGFISAVIALLIGILSLINQWRRFKRGDD